MVRGDSELVDVRGLESVHAADYLWGALEVHREADGWARPFRFSASQRRALTSCLAWHPGVYRQTSATTSGVCVRFTTDATRVVLAVRIDPEPPAVAAALREAREVRGIPGVEVDPSIGMTHPGAVDAASTLLDGISIVVDGRAQGLYEPRDGLVSVGLMDPISEPGMGVVALPGLGKKRHVAMWLPCMHDCVIRELWTDGTFVRRETPRRRLLVIGDATAQGFCCMDPARSWPALLAERLDLELVNHAVAGMVFQPSFAQYENVSHVGHVLIALGESYRDERCDAQSFAHDAKSFFATLARAFPDAALWASTPLWYDERSIPLRRGSCYEVVPQIMGECARQCGVQVVDGLGLLDHSALLMADRASMPDGRAHEQIAERLHAVMLVARASADDLNVTAHEVLLEATEAEVCLKPLYETVHRGLCEILYAARGCVLAMLRDGSQMLYADDLSLSAAVCDLYAHTDTYHVFGERMARWLAESFGLVRRKPRHLCMYEGAEPLLIDPVREECIQTLEECHAEEVLRHGGAWAEEEVRDGLKAGRFIGAFVGEKLVGFIGERSDGCMGQPEAFGKYKKEGWIEDLEKAKINAHLAAGEMPWMEVYPQNKALLRLQSRLGLCVLPASEACLMDRAPDGPYDSASEA